MGRDKPPLYFNMEKTVIYKQELNHYSTAFHKSCVDIDKKGASTHKVNRKDLLYFEHDYIDKTIEVMVENYGNPLCGISFRNSIILIEQLGPKVSLKLFTTTINRTVKFPDSAVAGEPITTFAPSSSGAQAYRRLAREVLAR